jgi:hypothetical protein
MAQRCIQQGCQRDAVEGSNYCQVHMKKRQELEMGQQQQQQQQQQEM